MNKRDLKSLLDEIYFGRSAEAWGGRRYYEEYIDDLHNYRFQDIVKKLIELYPASFCLDFFLSIQSLWQAMKVEDWFDLLKNNNPRRNPIVVDLDDGEFSDLVFIFKYVKVDIPSWFIEQKDISIRDKKYLIQFCIRKGPTLFTDEFDQEDLDGEYYIHQKKLNDLKDQFLKSNEVSSVDMNPEDYLNHIEKLKKELIGVRSCLLPPLQ